MVAVKNENKCKKNKIFACDMAILAESATYWQGFSSILKE